MKIMKIESQKKITVKMSRQAPLPHRNIQARMPRNNPANEHIHVQPEPDPVLKELAKQRKSMKRTMVAGFLCCGLLAGGIGFGGGLLANQMNGSSTTLYRSTAGKVEVQPVSAGSEMSVEQVAALNQPSVVEIKTEKVTNSSFCSSTCRPAPAAA